MRFLTRRRLMAMLGGAFLSVLLPRFRARRQRVVEGKPARFFRVLPAMLLALAWPASAQAKQVMEPVVAGSFYPADGAELRKMIERFLKQAGKPEVKGELYALVAPHAGYPYSGPAAAYAYRELKGRSFDLVVVMAPSHVSPLDGVSVTMADAYRTPLGEVPLAPELAQALTRKAKWISDVPALFAREHAMEVQLPWLQATLAPGYRVLPLVLGTADPALPPVLASLLSSVLRGKKVLFIASTDLSHYHGEKEAQGKDNATLSLIAALKEEELARRAADGSCELCGEGPVLTVMRLARRMGIERGTLLRYDHSGNTGGDRQRVVGYGAVAFADPPGGLTLAEKDELLTLARTTVERFVRTGTVPAVKSSPGLSRTGTCFVTLKRDGQLRGCIGQMEATGPLAESVRDNAVSSASRDHRFTPVKGEELPRLVYEISVLTPMERLADPKQAVVGRDGLLLSLAGRSGVFLPQVPVEQGWDRERYLDELCGKAGLPPGSWKDPQARLWRFTAEVFGE